MSDQFQHFCWPQISGLDARSLMTVAVDEIRESLLAEEARAPRLDEGILSEGSLRHKPGDEES